MLDGKTTSGAAGGAMKWSIHLFASLLALASVDVWPKAAAHYFRRAIRREVSARIWI